MTYRKKLIEVALPLEAINKESAREKSIRHGHPSTLHLWWARRPLAACRAVLFSQLVDDPSAHPDKFPTEEAQTKERERLFKIIEELVKWENINNEKVLNAARAEILKSTDGNPPPVLDPFCGGGSIPLEAQRLGLKAYASDLNPVAVLITKALIEIPPKFAGMPPVNPKAQKSFHWEGAKGLAEDVRYYGKWMRDEAEKRIGHLYPKVKITKEMTTDRPDLKSYVGQELTVIAWIWARTVPSPDPAFGGIQVPLARSFWLSLKKGKEAFIQPVIDPSKKKYDFKVKIGKPDDMFDPSTGTKPAGRGSNFECLLSKAIIDGKYIKQIGQTEGLKKRLMAIVCEGNRERVYLNPIAETDVEIEKAAITWKPEFKLTGKSADQLPLYGMKEYWQLFTPRQLAALTTFSDLISEVHDLVIKDAKRNEIVTDEHNSFSEEKSWPIFYANAVVTYLAFTLNRQVNRLSTISFWDQTSQKIQQAFGRQALAMTWDFCEANPIGNSSGNWMGQLLFPVEYLEYAVTDTLGLVNQIDATSKTAYSGELICCDPPYYDNICYADLSDFFYIWLRRTLKEIYPQILSTVMTPKDEELIASPYRFRGDRSGAAAFFEKGLGDVIEQWRNLGNVDYPTTVFYAFKQSETTNEGTASTGWETFLTGVINHGFTVTATWPIRTELTGNLKKQVAALASSVVLALIPRFENAPITTRREFIRELKQEMPDAFRVMQSGNIAPVDLAQAAIGPGIAVFSRYSKVIEADGSRMTVHSALTLINQMLDEVLAEQEGEYDADTRWALAWFEQYGVDEGPYGVAETLSIAKNTAVDALVKAGILMSKGGKVRLLKRNELAEDWDPSTDNRLTVWEITQHLIRLLVDKGSEEAASNLLKKVGGLGETARDLAYRIYIVCDRKKWAQEALVYNSLVVAWPELTKLAGKKEQKIETQENLFGKG